MTVNYLIANGSTIQLKPAEQYSMQSWRHSYSMITNLLSNSLKIRSMTHYHRTTISQILHLAPLHVNGNVLEIYWQEANLSDGKKILTKSSINYHYSSLN